MPENSDTSMLDTLWPTSWPIGKTELSLLGQLGDYVGGIIGTLLSLLTVYFIYRTFSLTRKTSLLTATVAVLAEMLKSHDAMINEVNEAVAQMHREFCEAYQISKEIFKPSHSITTQERIDISYSVTFFGLNKQLLDELSHYGEDQIAELHKILSRRRNTPGERYTGWFIGHQAVIAHYFRNLFAMYTFLESSPIGRDDKRSLGRVIRARMSNYSQALLALNIISHFGRDWEHDGLVEKYKPFSNVPQGFFGIDEAINLKVFFPYVEFEWERVRTRKNGGLRWYSAQSWFTRGIRRN